MCYVMTCLSFLLWYSSFLIVTRMNSVYLLVCHIHTLNQSMCSTKLCFQFGIPVDVMSKSFQTTPHIEEIYPCSVLLQEWQKSQPSCPSLLPSCIQKDLFNVAMLYHIFPGMSHFCCLHLEITVFYASVYTGIK